MDDSKTCWHGSGIFEDCNNKLWSRNLLIRYWKKLFSFFFFLKYMLNHACRYHGRQCKWWHFTPEEREPALNAKFDEIVSGQAESGVLNSILGSAKGLQKEWFGKTLF